MSLTLEEKALVHELTIEYVKENQLLKCQPGEISEQIRQIGEISKTISNVIERESRNFKWL